MFLVGWLNNSRIRQNSAILSELLGEVFRAYIKLSSWFIRLGGRPGTSWRNGNSGIVKLDEQG